MIARGDNRVCYGSCGIGKVVRKDEGIVVVRNQEVDVVWPSTKSAQACIIASSAWYHCCERPPVADDAVPY